MSMSRAKRFQIPVNDEENRLFQRAARASGVAAAEWARTRLKKEAALVLSTPRSSPRAAVDGLRKVNAPTGDIATMIRQSTKDRYGRLP